jgi:hypothetical protein
MHIPPHKLLPQDMVDVVDHGPPDNPHDPPQVLRMHVTDARHAMQVEPNRYSLTAETILEEIREDLEGVFKDGEEDEA